MPECNAARNREKGAIVNYDPAVCMDECHYELIQGMAQALKPQRVLEIGIGSGICSRRLLRALAANNFGELISVDNWHDWGGQRPEWIRPSAHWTIAEQSEEHFIKTCQDRFGLIVSDGDHHRADQWARETLDLLEPGGVAFFHDVANADFPNLMKIHVAALESGYSCRLFNRSTLPSERCYRGLLMVHGR